MEAKRARISKKAPAPDATAAPPMADPPATEVPKEAPKVSPKAKRAKKAAATEAPVAAPVPVATDAPTEAPKAKRAKKAVVLTETHVKKNVRAIDAPTEEEPREAVAPAQVLDHRKIGTYSVAKLRQFLSEPKEYQQLQKFHKAAKKLHLDSPEVVSHKTKMRMIERAMKEMVFAGKVVFPRRVEGTGTLQEVERVYQDTPENREKNRVGQTFKVARWVGATYEQVVVTRCFGRKKKRDPNENPGEKRKPTAWIEALQKAREELAIGKEFLPVCATLPENPTEKQTRGHQLYTLAKKHHSLVQKQPVEAVAVAATV